MTEGLDEGPVIASASLRIDKMETAGTLHDRLAAAGSALLVEAMASGCVPVASALRGVTDMIIDHGRDGLLFPVGSPAAAARLIAGLDQDRARLSRLAAGARRKVSAAFSVDQMAACYATVLEDIAAGPPPIAPPLPMEGWKLPSGLRPGLRTYLPRPLKNWLRVVRERL